MKFTLRASIFAVLFTLTSVQLVSAQAPITRVTPQQQVYQQQVYQQQVYQPQMSVPYTAPLPYQAVAFEDSTPVACETCVGGGGGGQYYSNGSAQDSIGIWFGADYLYWQTSGMKIPPLATSNPIGSPNNELGVIGAASTQILLGNDTILDGGRSGIRYRAGAELRDGIGLEGEYFQLFDVSANYRFDFNLGVVLGRPFINMAPLTPPVRWDTELVYVPGVIDGYLNVFAHSRFQGTAARFTFDLCKCCRSGSSCSGGCDSGCGSCGTSDCCDSSWCDLRLTAGYRHLDLSELLRVEEYLVAGGDIFDIYDEFGTSSRFHGIEVGFEGDFRCSKNNLLNIFSRVAVGMNTNNISIAGQTIDTIAAVTTTRDGGILAQASNIGTSSHRQASLAAEFGLNLRTKWTSHLSSNVGYSCLFWGNVARPGEQIDMNVNPNLFPPPTAVPGTIGAQRTHRLSDFFAHGLNAGLTYSF